MSKVFQPEHVVTDNPHGGMVYGPVSDENNDDGTRYLQTVKGGHTIIVNENGNKLDHTPGTHNELCGTKLNKSNNNTDPPNESVAKAIVARHGDIVIVAEHGNIKLKAQNIWVETTDKDRGGNFLVNSNGHIGLTAGQKVTLGATKMCMIAKENITLTSGVVDVISNNFNVSDSPVSGIFSILTNISLANMIKLANRECGG